MLNKSLHTQRNHFIAILLLGVLAYYFASISLFVHSHVVNGVTVVHSHIHGSSHQQNKSGNHSEIEITLISALSYIQAEQASNEEFNLIAPCFTIQHDAYECSFHYAFCTFSANFGRAPPSTLG